MFPNGKDLYFKIGEKVMIRLPFFFKESLIILSSLQTCPLLVLWSPIFSKHFAHVNVLILILGIGATFGSVSDLAGYLLNGNELERPLATVEQFTTFVLCLVGFIISIKSFINARKG